MSSFSITDLPLTGLKLVLRERLGDSRGFLSRMYCAEELARAGWEKSVVQINHSYTARRGTVRGMHYQDFPYTEMKLVSCIRGEVWDVAVDLRAESATFLKWHAQVLSAENGHALLIPEGFAHGFQSLTEECELLYLHTAAYQREAEVGIRYNDASLAINWPIEITEISARDQSHESLTSEFKGIVI